MATRSLGTLTLDLVAKIGGFEQGMGKAEKRTEKWRKEVKKNVEAAGKAFAAGSAVAAGALAIMTTKVVNNAREIENLSAVANTGTREFQELTYASRRYGIEQDKVADILKDTSDKVGDFLQTGGGPLADFFDNIAPQVGVTAEEFRNLSGADALGLYVSSLEKANLSQNEMTFFMEAIASDATLLLPLLRDNSRELSRLAEEADEVGAVISDIEIKQLAEVKDNVDDLSAAFGGLQNELVLGALPALRDLTELTSDPETLRDLKELSSDIGEGLATALKTVTATAVGAYSAFQLAGKGIATIAAAIDAADIDIADVAFPPRAAIKIARNFDNIQTALAVGFEDVNRTALDAADTLDKIWDIGNRPPPEIEAKITIDTSDANFDAILPELEREFGNIDVGLQDILPDLETEFSEEAAARMTTAMGDYQDLVRELQTDEERLTQQVRDRLAVLEAVQDITDEQRNETLSRIAGAALADAPELGGVSSFEGIDSARMELQSWYDEQRQMLERFRQDHADVNATWNEEEFALQEDYEKRLTALKQQEEQLRRQQELEGYQVLLDAAGMYYSHAEGEEAAYARAAISIGSSLLDERKRAALESIIASTHSAAMGAYDALSWIYLVGPVLGAAAAGTVYAAGATAAAGVAGLAHDGIDSIPEDGTWLLEKGERVTTAETSAKLDRTLENIQRDQRDMGRGGGVTVNQTLNIEGKPDRRTSSQIARDTERRQRMTTQRLGTGR